MQRGCRDANLFRGETEGEEISGSATLALAPCVHGAARPNYIELPSLTCGGRDGVMAFEFLGIVPLSANTDND